jgi:hypothetical protein
VKRFAAIIVPLVALLIPATATAKGPVDKLALCGPGGCSSLPVPPAMRTGEGIVRLMNAPEVGFVPPAGPYYELRVRSLGHTEILFVLPAQGLLDLEPGWRHLPVALRAPVLDAAQQLRPYDFVLSRVRLGTRTAADPAAYAPLLSLPYGGILASDAYKHSTRWITMEFTTTRPTPWTIGTLRGYYDPVLRAVQVNGRPWARVPATLAGRIAREASLHAAGSNGGQGGGLRVGAALAGLGLLGAAAAMLRRRRHGRRPPVA